MSLPRLAPLHRRYLRVLGVEQTEPSTGYLLRLVRAHLYRVPFENISKLCYLRTRGLRGVPDLALYLDGIETRGLGGTCYTNNPYFSELLRVLGFDADLCGADMSEPDVHTVILIGLADRQYLVDVGYGAPFDRPFPRDLDRDLEIRLGNERWVIKPQDREGRTRVEHHRDGRLIHGYVAKPEPRSPDFFRPAVEASFRAESTFMSTVRVVRFGDGWSHAISDLNLIRATGATCEVRRLADRDELVRVVEEDFAIPPAVTREALRAISDPGP